MDAISHPQRPVSLKQLVVVMLLAFVVLALYVATLPRQVSESALYNIGDGINAGSQLGEPLSADESYAIGDNINGE